MANRKPRKNNIFDKCKSQESLIKCYQEYVLKHGPSQYVNKQYGERMSELDFLKIK